MKLYSNGFEFMLAIISKAFSELNLNLKTVDNIKMCCIFEVIVRRFSENAETGNYYNPKENRHLINI